MATDGEDWHWTEYVGCVCWLILPGAMLSLCLDVIVWDMSQDEPASVWTVVLGIVTSANILSLFLPFLLRAMVRRRVGRRINGLWFVIGMLVLWVLHLWAVSELWFAICPQCYFG
jgi:hypothetical protein